MVLRLVPLVAAAAVSGCGHLVTQEAHERIVKGLRQDMASLEARAAQADSLARENQKLRAENELLRAHSAAYGELSGELRQVLDELSADGFHRTPRGSWSIETQLLFAPGSARISEKGREILSKFLSVWKGKTVAFRIVGHTDSDPIVRTANIYRTKTNLELGMHRALAVMEAFLEAGIDEKSITIESRGNAEPVTTGNGTPEDKRRNRRVEIYVMKN